ncbi:Y-family DNA polymerase [Undibacterium sp. SXout7W]|uniref:Y-family DNA polymerase n=1 Tax=Undibacterium sp. SXout7W TaxID=3413049 RepID=UPI003BF3937A
MRYVALIDCNNFYVSCQVVFNPRLAGKAVVVLSNNDSCVISRSSQAKALGVKMGVPLYQIRELVKQHDIQVLSSNYPLYADMSNRVMSILGRYSPIQEIYSIDECFVDLTGMSDIKMTAEAMRSRVQLETGIPVCVGVGPTKTLSKLANFVAKRHPRSNGVFNISDLTQKQQDSVFSNILIEEVWGIGRKLNASLVTQGISTVAELRDANIAGIRTRYGLVLERIVRELRGEDCIEIEEVAPAKQQIITSRSFGQVIESVEDIQDALAHFVSNAAFKLRQQESVASVLQVFIMTDRFRDDRPQYCPSITIPLISPSASSTELQQWAVRGLQDIFREGFQYKRAGVILSGILPAAFYQGDLFVNKEHAKPGLMRVMDDINARYGRGTLKLSQDGCRMAWAMRQENKSPAYTTDWDQLPVCR